MYTCQNFSQMCRKFSYKMSQLWKIDHTCALRVASQVASGPRLCPSELFRCMQGPCMSEIFLNVGYWWDGHAGVKCDFGGPVSPVCATRVKWQQVNSFQSAPPPPPKHGEAWVRGYEATFRGLTQETFLHFHCLDYLNTRSTYLLIFSYSFTTCYR